MPSAGPAAAGPGGRRRAPKFVVPSFARYALDNETVQDIMEGGRQVPESTITIQKFVDLWAVPDQADYVVIEEPRKLAGVVYLKDIRRMADGNVTVVPVVDGSTGELVGSVTASDVMASVIGGGKPGAK
jgi:CBS domain-containing protein